MNIYSAQALYYDISCLYDNVNDFPFKKTRLPEDLIEFGTVLEKTFGVSFIEWYDAQKFKMTEDNNNVIVAFSGGKDSAALATKLRNNGYNVFLAYIQGINKAYPDEKSVAMKFAEKYKYPFLHLAVDVKVRKGSYAENIVKNNLIIAKCLQYGQAIGIKKVGLGCAVLTSNVPTSFGFSDGAENLQSFAKGVQEIVDCEIFVSEVESESLSYKILVDNKIDFTDIVSCMTPVYYRKNLNNINIRKGIILRHNGCGSCYKCAADYFHLSYFGLFKNNEQSDKHYMNILWKSWHHSANKKPESDLELLSCFLNSKYIDINSILKRIS
jgi:hypothetical protein